MGIGTDPICFSSQCYLYVYIGWSNFTHACSKSEYQLLASMSGRGHSDIEDILKLVGLEQSARKKVGKYSMGMRQRLGIAQAIMEDQSILLLDEPMNGLDNQGVEEMRDLFMALREQGKTILLASHNRDDIEILCDEVYEMDHGILTRFAT